eukprot:jgi/Mesen1/10697/ME000090S10158
MADVKPARLPSLSPCINQVVIPGDAVVDLNENAGRTLRVGGGLQQEGDVVVATRAGIVRSARNGKLWIESSFKRYLPAVEDAVIGIVMDRHAENFDVDIGGPCKAVLPALAFENATRRNRPNLQARATWRSNGRGGGARDGSEMVFDRCPASGAEITRRRGVGRAQVGSVAYARVVKVHVDMDPQLTCVDAGFGPLIGGYLFDCSSGLARSLLASPPCAVLAALGESHTYELAVGINGRVWVNSDSISTTILVATAIQNAEYLSPVQQKSMVRQLLRRSK